MGFFSEVMIDINDAIIDGKVPASNQKKMILWLKNNNRLETWEYVKNIPAAEYRDHFQGYKPNPIYYDGGKK